MAITIFGKSIKYRNGYIYVYSGIDYVERYNSTSLKIAGIYETNQQDIQFYFIDVTDTFLFAAAGQGTIFQWDLKTEALVNSYQIPKEDDLDITSIKVYKNLLFVASRGETGSIDVWDFTTNTKVRTIKYKPRGDETSIEVCKDVLYVVGGTICDMYDISSGERIKKVDLIDDVKPSYYIQSIPYGDDPDTLYFYTNNPNITVISYNPNKSTLRYTCIKDKARVVRILNEDYIYYCRGKTLCRGSSKMLFSENYDEAILQGDKPIEIVKMKENIRTFDFGSNKIFIKLDNQVHTISLPNQNEDTDTFTVDTDDKKGISAYKRYFAYAPTGTSKTRQEEEMQGYPSEMSEKEHYDYIAGLNTQDTRALEKYQEDSSDINSLVRMSYQRNKVIGSIDEITKRVSKLRGLIRNAPTLNEDIIVYRGDPYADFEIGATVTMTPFLSTSTSPESASKFAGSGTCCILEFKVPRWANIALLLYVAPLIEYFRTEFEVLFINGTQWEVTYTGYKQIQNKKYRLHRLRLKNANLQESLFAKTCLSSITFFPETIQDINGFYKKCTTDPTNRACVLFEAGLKTGKLVSSRQQLFETCGKLFNKREMTFQHSTWKKISHQSCLTNNEINGYLLTKKLGSGTVGEVYKACKCTGDKVCSFASCVAVKETKLYEDDLVVFNKGPSDSPNIYSKEAMRYQSWGEVVANEMVTLLIEQNVCPNYIGMYHWFTCEDKLYMINEVATWGDMYKWVSKPRSSKEKLSANFQIFSAIYAMQRHFGLVHSDLYLNNILVTNVNKEQRMSYWEYIINGESYYVPNYGHQFLLADFGRAYIPGKLEMKYQIEEKNWYKTNLRRLGLHNDQIMFLDYTHVFTELKENNVQDDVLKHISLESILSKFVLLKLKPKNYEIIAKFDLDATIDVPDKLVYFHNQKKL